MLKRLIWLPLLLLMGFGMTVSAQEASPTVETACAGIQDYADGYTEVWTAFIARASEHVELYDKPAQDLTAEEFKIIRDDVTFLMVELAKLNPPDGLHRAWTAEIAYWAGYATLLDHGQQMGAGYTDSEYGMTMMLWGNHLTRAIASAKASCPVWQETIDEINAMTENMGAENG